MAYLHVLPFFPFYITLHFSFSRRFYPKRRTSETDTTQARICAIKLKFESYRTSMPTGSAPRQCIECIEASFCLFVLLFFVLTDTLQTQTGSLSELLRSGFTTLFGMFISSWIHPNSRKHQEESSLKRTLSKDITHS